MKIINFREMYLKELQEVQSVEAQLDKTWSRMVKLATDESLKELITNHMHATQSQLDRLDSMLKQHGADPDQHKDQSMSALVSESEKWVQMLDDATLRDTGLIASIQKIKHYQIAAYGTLACWAKHLKHDEDMETLLKSLDESKEMDDKLSTLAKQEINPDALR